VIRSCRWKNCAGQIFVEGQGKALLNSQWNIIERTKLVLLKPS
jgi:hypothetical protein